MAAFDLIQTPTPSPRLRRLPHQLRLAIASVVDWNDARLTRKSLGRLSPRELSDIGLHRGDIDAFVHRR